jgi:hypothetical protein
MKTLRAVSFATILVGCGAVACSSSNQSSSNGQSSSGGGSGGGAPGNSCGAIVACNYLSASDVNGVLSTSLPAGVEHDTSAPTGVTDYGCQLASSDAQTQVTLGFICDPQVTNGPDVYSAIGYTPNQSISGLGEAAFWLTSVDGGGALASLIVYYGEHANFSVGVLLPPASTVDRHAAAVSLAKAVAKNLGI